MEPARDQRPPRILQTIFVLAAFLFAGNFLYARLFSVYDDDFIFTVPPFFWSRAEAWVHVKIALLNWPQGRPVGFALTHLISYFSAQFPSLGVGYLIGFGILLSNAVLLNRLAIRFLNPPAALLSAVVLVLYPTDTSKAILMHRVFIQMNLMFLLLALFLYVRGRRGLSYVIASLSFLTYEPVYLIFLIAPLLVDSLRDLSWKRCLRHGVICVVTVAGLLAIRRYIGDPRIGETFGNPAEVIERIGQALYLGPKTVLQTLTGRPLEAIWATDAQLWIVVLLCAGAFVIASGADESSPAEVAGSARRRALWLAGVGAIGLLLGYIICFRSDYWPPIMTIGRLSDYHAAGSIGASLMVGGIFAYLLELAPRLRPWLVVAGALYCGLLASFGIEVQRIDYVKHSEQQSRFWRTIIDSSGEWNPDTVILVDIDGTDSGRPYTPGMPIWWTVNFAPTLLERLVEWPADWPQRVSSKLPHRPRVYGYVSSFETELADDAVVVKTPAWMGPDFWPKIKDGTFIYYRFSNGHMVRVTELVMIGGRPLHPLPLPVEPKPQLRTSRFFDLLFARETSWQTILQARNYPR